MQLVLLKIKHISLKIQKRDFNQDVGADLKLF